jgi:hypothetical protein
MTDTNDLRAKLANARNAKGYIAILWKEDIDAIMPIIERHVAERDQTIARLREALSDLASEAFQVCDEGCGCELCQEVTKARVLLAETAPK